MYNIQNDIPSENTLKHLSSHAGFIECHQTSIPLHSEQGECFDSELCYQAYTFKL